MKVSVIIPVYNCELFIARCIDSVLRQTYTNYELILINDGSKDLSLTILYEYQEKYKNKIVVIDQVNAGASAARNAGMERASGDYITFIDSDDYVDEDFLEAMLEDNNGEDIVVSGYKKVNQEEKILFEKIPVNCEWSLFKYTTVWANLYRTNFIKDNQILFSSFVIGEDIDFTIQCITQLKSYRIKQYAGYYYFINDASLTNTINSDDKISSVSELFVRINDIVLANKYKKARELYFYFLKTCIFNIIMQRKNASVQNLYALFSKEFNEFINFTSVVFFKKRFCWQKGEDMSANFVVNIFLFAYKMHLLKGLLWVMKKV